MPEQRTIYTDPTYVGTKFTFNPLAGSTWTMDYTGSSIIFRDVDNAIDVLQLNAFSPTVRPVTAFGIQNPLSVSQLVSFKPAISTIELHPGSGVDQWNFLYGGGIFKIRNETLGKDYIEIGTVGKIILRPDTTLNVTSPTQSNDRITVSPTLSQIDLFDNGNDTWQTDWAGGVFKLRNVTEGQDRIEVAASGIIVLRPSNGLEIRPPGGGIIEINPFSSLVKFIPIAGRQWRFNWDSDRVAITDLTSGAVRAEVDASGNILLRPATLINLQNSADVNKFVIVDVVNHNIRLVPGLPSGSDEWKILYDGDAFILRNETAGVNVFERDAGGEVFIRTKGLDINLEDTVLTANKFVFRLGIHAISLEGDSVENWAIRFDNNLFRIFNDATSITSLLANGLGSVSLSAPATITPDVFLITSHIAFSIDEGGNNIQIKARYSNGTTVNTFNVPLVGGGGGAAIYGTGVDGNVTINSNTTLTRDMYYDALTVDATFILDTAGFRVFANTSVTCNGTIRSNGNDGSGLTAGALIADQVLGGGAAGGNGDADAGIAGLAQIDAVGGAGGVGGTGDTGGTPGGAAGAVTAPSDAQGGVVIVNSMNGIETGLLSALGGATLYTGGAGGGGGGGQGGNAGGGGGGGAGVLVVCSPLISGSGTISANGGAGAVGTAINTGGGGGGGGGAALTISEVTPTCTVEALAGDGGASGGGTGNPGVAGAAGVSKSLLNV